jgi:hypothetical protein
MRAVTITFLVHDNERRTVEEIIYEGIGTGRITSDAYMANEPLTKCPVRDAVRKAFGHEQVEERDELPAKA